MAEPVEDEVEEGEHGDRDQDLEDFIKRREDSRGHTDEMFDFGFYTVTVFETHDQKMAWLEFLKEKYGIEADREVFINGFAMAKQLGKTIEYSGLKFPKRKPSEALQEMAMDGSSEGWEVASGAMPEGASAEEEAAEEPEDEGNTGIL